MMDFDKENDKLVVELTTLMQKIKIAKQLKEYKLLKSLNKDLKNKNKEIKELQKNKLIHQLHDNRYNNLNYVPFTPNNQAVSLNNQHQAEE
uniref:Uncharacterized protein n=1 Tax=viral metagenome TaxID=1070528 RepID=A0A6C0AYL5_9ZZZZ|tara:strand:- start:289 stop:561 length:273 start_codon:yes stop_codon:yes gene_type:complete